MSQKTDAALQTQNDTIQNETNTGANTAARVGQMIEDLIDSKMNNDQLLDEDNMATNSATRPASQQSIKAYVDAIGDPAWGEVTGTLSNQTDLQTALGLKADLASPALTGTPTAPTAAGGTNTTQVATTAFVQAALSAAKSIMIEVTDEVTNIAAGTSVRTFRMPYALTLTAVRASLITAQAAGSIFTLDINEAGTSVLSTKLTIDNTETTSVTAVTPAVISDAALADDALITVDIDQIGDGSAIGLKITLIGT